MRRWRVACAMRSRNTSGTTSASRHGRAAGFRTMLTLRRVREPDALARRAGVVGVARGRPAAFAGAVCAGHRAGPRAVVAAARARTGAHRGQHADRASRSGRGRPRTAGACMPDRNRTRRHRDGRGVGSRRALRLVRGVEGLEHFDAALHSGRGLIVAAPHLGCWELLNYWLCSRTRIAILYAPPRDRAWEALLVRARGGLAPEQVRADGAGVRRLYKRLADGGVVGILPDQQPRHGEGQFAPFFGTEANTMVRLPRGAGYRIRILPAPDGIADADLRIACGALNRGVEQCVELAFTQYQWTY